MAALLIGMISWQGYRMRSPPGRKNPAQPPPFTTSSKEALDVPPIATLRQQVASAKAKTTDRWQVRWDELAAAGSSVERNRERCALLKDLARRDAGRALWLARSETDQELRENLFRAALEGWASVQVDAAGEWALQQNDLSQDLAMAAVFNGAGASPESAQRFAQQLSQRFPERAQDYGSYLIFSLGQAGAYHQAAGLATAGPPAVSQNWITAAFDAWARREPEAAVLAATDLADPEKRSTAFRASIYAWAKTDPKALVDYAEGFPTGEERTFALLSGLRAWHQKEPELTKAWIAKAGEISGIERVFED